MHSTISYADRLTPAFDAVNDIKEWLGRKWDELSPLMAKVKDQEQFEFYAGLAGIRGYPVIAWYELYQGQGSWEVVGAYCPWPMRFGEDGPVVHGDPNGVNGR